MNAFSRRILDELRDGTVLAPERLGQIETALAPGLPTARDENWKYANLRALERARFNPATDIAPEALLAASAALPAALPGFDRVVFVDGLHAAALGSSPPPRGVAILPPGTAGAGRTLIEAEVAPPAPSLWPRSGPWPPRTPPCAALAATATVSTGPSCLPMRKGVSPGGTRPNATGL